MNIENYFLLAICYTVYVSRLLRDNNIQYTLYNKITFFFVWLLTELKQSCFGEATAIERSEMALRCRLTLQARS